MSTLPVTFSVPTAIANNGVYAAIFGNRGSGSGPQVFLQSTLGSDGNSIVASATLSTAVTLPFTTATPIVITGVSNFPTSGGTLLLTQTDSYNNIQAQTTVTYTAYDGNMTFTGISGGNGTFTASNTQVTLALDWTLSDTLAVGQNVPLLNLFPLTGTYTGTTVTATVNLPDPSTTANSIYSGELVMFVGSNSGLQANSAQALVVPTLGSNPNDTFGLFEWGLAGALTANSGGFIDYDVSAIDQVGFPFQVTAQLSNGVGNASTNPPQPFDNGVGFLQTQDVLFNGFTPYLKALPASSNGTAFISLAPENSLSAKRITAPQDLLNFVVNSGPAFVEAPAPITGLQPIQNPAGTSNFTFTVNPQSVAVQIAGSGYTNPPKLTFSAPTSGTTAAGTATVSGGALTGINFSNLGSGYTASPNITVAAPPTGGTQGAMAVGLLGQTLNYAVTALRIGVTMSSGGSGYTSLPTVTFSAPTNGGTAATGIAQLGTGKLAGQVVGVYIVNPGSGYTTQPTVIFSGGGGSGAAATSCWIESMAGTVGQVQVNAGTLAVLNWNSYPFAAAYNIYRSPNANMSGAVQLNSSPVFPITLASGTTLSGTANSISTTITISTTPPSTISPVGTLLITEGENQSLFQYTSYSGTTFTGAMFGTASFDSNAVVTLVPNFTDNGITGTAATPPLNNYKYEPLNRYFTAALQDFFNYYSVSTNHFFEIDLAGVVSTKWKGQSSPVTIDGNSYMVLHLKGEQGTYGNNFAGDTANIYLPFFSTNVDPNDFPGVTLPPPPSWLTNPYESPSAMVFGADGVFGIPDNTGVSNPAAPLSTAPTDIVKDIMNPINAAINRGLTPRKVNGTWTNEIIPDNWAQAPLFPITAVASQSGGILPQTTVYYAVTGVNVNGTKGETIPTNIVTVLSSAFATTPTNSVTLTIPNTGITTFSQFYIYRGTSPDAMRRIGVATPVANSATTFVDNGDVAIGGQLPPFIMNAPGQSVNWYAAYLHQLSVSINGFAYGTPYDDQGSFSTNVNLNYTAATPQPPQGLTITLLGWTS